jgi:hypothetical protein
MLYFDILMTSPSCFYRVGIEAKETNNESGRCWPEVLHRGRRDCGSQVRHMRWVIGFFEGMGDAPDEWARGQSWGLAAAALGIWDTESEVSPMSSLLEALRPRQSPWTHCCESHEDISVCLHSMWERICSESIPHISHATGTRRNTSPSKMLLLLTLRIRLPH